MFLVSRYKYFSKGAFKNYVIHLGGRGGMPNVDREMTGGVEDSPNVDRMTPER